VRQQRAKYEYYRVVAVERALELLRVFAQGRAELTLSQIAERMRLHKSTVHRLALTLEKAGFLRRSPTTGAYSLGLKLLELGAVVLNSLELRTQARPHLERLRRDTGYTVHLGILDAGEVVYIDKIEGDTPVRIYSQVGRRAPAHCTGLGKALLAFQPAATVREVAATRGLRRYTPETIISVSELLSELERVRERGYAVDMAEHEPLVHCVSAPIRDHNSEVIAAVSITLIAPSLSAAEVERYASAVVATALAISADMGWASGAGTAAEDPVAGATRGGSRSGGGPLP